MKAVLRMTLAAAIAAGLFHPIGACAAETTAPATTPKSMFAQMDTNGDNKVTPDELKAFLKERYKLLDANGDNKLTEKEFVEGVRKQWQAYDADRDGGWSAAEKKNFYVGHAPKADKLTSPGLQRKGSVFQQIDTNANGVIEPWELVAYFDAEWAKIQRDKAGANITPKEHERIMRQRFRAMDTNKDKTVTLDEYAKYWTGEATIGK